jgi:hypothetical protein
VEKALQDELHKAFMIKYEVTCASLEDPFNLDQMMTNLNQYNHLLYEEYEGREKELWAQPEIWNITNHTMLIMNTFRGLPLVLSIPTITESLGVDFTKEMSQQ